MRILHLLSQRPELTGSGVYVVAMLEQAAARGHEGVLVAGVPEAFAPPERIAPGGAACAACHFVRFGRDVPFAVTGMSDVMPYASTRWRDLGDEELAAYEACFTACLGAAVGEARPDLIHANHLWLATALARRLFPGLPVVASCHGSDLRQFLSVPRIAERIREDCRRLDGVLALSRAQAAEIAGLYGLDPARIHVTGAGFDAGLFRPDGPAVPATGRGEGPVRLLYAGKLHRAKGVPWLLRACARLAAQGLDFTLDLCGQGAGKDQRECEALAAGLGPRACFLGNVGQAELAARMRGAEVFVLPSFFEGVPLVLLEALACGCRLVATALPGVAEVFAGLPAEVLRLVALPRLEGVDRPVAEDEAGFTDRLAAALAEQCRAARNAPMPPVAEFLAAHTWEGVFGRVEAVYAAVTAARGQAAGGKDRATAATSSWHLKRG